MSPSKNAMPAPAGSDEGGGFDIFISHAGENRAVAVRLRQALVDAGVRPWASFVDIPVGAPYPEQIVRAIAGCRAMVLLVSAASMQSEHVYREVVEASSRAQKMALLPIYIEPDVAIPAGLRYYLNTLHRMKFPADRIELAVPMIAAALRDRSDWQRHAIAPSLAERLTASPLRTWGGGLAVTVTAGLIVWGAQSLWGLRVEHQQQQRHDALPDSLAMLEAVSAERPGADTLAPWQLRLNVMLVSDRARFSELKLLAHTEDASGQGSTHDLTGAIAPEQVGGGQMLSVSVPQLGSKTTFCLSLPHPRTGQMWRLSTPYAAVRHGEGGLESVRFRPLGPPVSMPDDGSPCR